MILEVKVYDFIGQIKTTAEKLKKAVVFAVQDVKKLIGAIFKGSETITGPPVKVKKIRKTKQA